MEKCSKCILPKEYPGINFDSKGVCNYCRDYENRWDSWTESEADFLRIAKQKMGTNLEEPCILGLSGGKDSSYLLHILIRKYEFKNVKTFTYDNGFLSDGAKDNIAKLCESLGVENKLKRLPKAIEQSLYKNAIHNKSAELCMFCMSPAITGLIDYAKSNKASYIMMGSSPRTEPQFPLTMLNAFDYKFFKDVIGTENCNSEVLGHFKFTKPRNAASLFVSNEIKFLNLAEYIDWNPKEIIALLKKEYDWVDYGEGIPHFDCMLEPLIDHFMYKRLGFSKVVDNISILIRRGFLSREEALVKYEQEEVKDPPVYFIKEFCKRIGIEEEDFEPYLKGESLDYTHFKSNAAVLNKMSPLLKALSKVGLIPDSIYRKYVID